jgi:hypothetical protein
MITHREGLLKYVDKVIEVKKIWNNIFYTHHIYIEIVYIF